MSEQNQLAVQEPMSFERMEKMAKAAAESGMFGIKNSSQALCLFAICQSEGMDPISALRRYHIVDGKPSMRADAMSADFMKHGGAILWHVRSDGVCAATFFADKTKLDDAARTRAKDRFSKLWDAESSEDENEIINLMTEVSTLAVEGEETIIRTYGDAEEKGITKSWRENPRTKEMEHLTKKNWEQSPRQMLTARVITEGVRLINPGLIAGIYTPEEVQDIRAQEEEFVQTALSSPKARDREAIQAMIDQYLEDAKTAKPAEKSRLQGLAAELRCQLADMEGSARTVQAEVLPSESEAELNLRNEPTPQKIPWKDYVLQHVTSKVLKGKKLGSFTPAEVKTIYEKTKHALTAEDPKIRTEAQYIEEAYNETSKEGKP